MTLQQSWHFFISFLIGAHFAGTVFSCCNQLHPQDTGRRKPWRVPRVWSLSSFLFGWEGEKKHTPPGWWHQSWLCFGLPFLIWYAPRNWEFRFSRWSLFATHNRWWSLMEVDVTQFSGEKRSIFGTWSYCERNSSYKHHSIHWTLWAQAIFSNVDLG